MAFRASRSRRLPAAAGRVHRRCTCSPRRARGGRPAPPLARSRFRRTFGSKTRIASGTYICLLLGGSRSMAPVRARRTDRQGVRGNPRFSWLQQVVDRVKSVTFAPLQPGVLAFVLLPGADDEHLLEQVAVSEVLVQVPVRRTGPTPGATKLPSRLQKGRVLAGAYVVPDGDDDRPFFDRRVQVRKRQRDLGQRDPGGRRRECQGQVVAATTVRLAATTSSATATELACATAPRTRAPMALAP